MINGMGHLRLRACWRGMVSTASTSVSKTESPGSNPGAPAKKGRMAKLILSDRRVISKKE